MRIATARVRGYRSVADLAIDFDGLTALVGAGGVGKSAFLRALNWFFEGGSLDEEDLHRPVGEGPASERVTVAVTFTGLNDLDRSVLGRYAGDDPTTLTRSWSPGEKDKLSGRALVFPGFDAVRDREATAAERKSRYKELHKERGEELGLPEPLNRQDELLAALEEWERANPEHCELRDEEATHLQGAVGTPTLAECFKYVLVEATTEAGEVVRDGRGTPLDRLLSAIGDLDEETEQRIDSLQTKAQEEMRELISGAREDGLRKIAQGITRRVQSYVPGAEVELSDVVSPLSRPSVTVLAQVRHQGGHATDVDRQGHGLQRALVIGVLHELADASALAADATEGSPPPPSLMLAVEEPELYQHPLQARALAATLDELARAMPADGGRSVQVSYSTHSSHFVRPALFESLRLCGRGAGGQMTSVTASKERVRQILASAGFEGDLGGRVEHTVATQLAEAVFARAVVLCEGATDAATLEAVALREGGFDREGIAVVDVGTKTLIPICFSILEQLSIPTYVLFDGDRAKRDRPAEVSAEKRAEAEAAAADAARQNRRLLGLCGEPEEDWPDDTVRPHCANFHDCIETFFSEHWPQMNDRRSEVGRQLGMKGKSAPVYRQAALEAEAVPSLLIDIVKRAKELG